MISYVLKMILFGGLKQCSFRPPKNKSIITAKGTRKGSAHIESNKNSYHCEVRHMWKRVINAGALTVHVCLINPPCMNKG